MNRAGRTFATASNVVGNGKAPSLLRVNNTTYVPTRLRFTQADGVTPEPLAELIAHDGRALRDTSDPSGPSRPLRDLGRRVLTDRLAFGAAERYDMLLVPPRPGEFKVHVEWLDWITGKLLATRTLPLFAQ